MIDHIPLDDLSALLDGALPTARQAQVEAHLATCEACRAELGSLTWVDGFLSALPDVEAPPSATFHIPVDEAEDSPEAGKLLRPRFDRAWAGLGAIAAMVTIAFLLGQLTGRARYDAREMEGSAAEMADAAVDGEDGVMAERAEGSAAQSVGAGAGEAVEADAEADGEALFPLDAAANRARERIAEGDDAEERVEPLGTAIRADRGELVAGEDAAEPAAALRLGTPEDLEGGYKPPGKEIPGAISARDLRQIGPVTATQIAAAVSTAERVLTQAPEDPAAPAGAAQATIDASRYFVTPPVLASGASTAVRPTTPDAAATPPAEGRPRSGDDDVSAADEAAPSEDEAGAGGDVAADASAAESSEDAAAADADSELAFSSGAEAPAPPAAEAEAEAEGGDDASAAPRALILPLAAVSIGLLALALLLWRQARRRSRRHRDRVRDR